MSTKDLISQDLNEKVKKNLLNFFYITVAMLFAGFTSAYLVARGSSFWVKVPLPDAFKISTLVIVVSSAFLIVTKYAIKKDNFSLVKTSMAVALVSGTLFGYFQWKGFEQLFSSGYGISGPVIVNEGQYGNIFTMTYEGKSLSFDNEKFFWKGEEVSEDMHQKIKDFGESLGGNARKYDNNFKLDNYGTGFMLFYETLPITYANNQLFLDDKPLDEKQLGELYYFAENLANDRGDFVMDGKYGEDFVIAYGGKELTYENRTFYMDGKELSPKLKNDLYGAQNHASAFIYVFTGMHLLHWIGGIIALIVVFIKGLLNKYTKSDYLGITLASRYWHFLGILWLYLYGFLIFIH